MGRSGKVVAGGGWRGLVVMAWVGWGPDADGVCSGVALGDVKQGVGW